MSSFKPSHKRVLARVALLAGVLTLAACAGERGGESPAQPQGHYKVGQPYQINGIWYYPHEDYNYDETGIASWYGTEYSGTVRTANGEVFNKDELTAAHKTLPMPSLARVTNLENGKSIVVRVNDRGPFSGSRIIDVTPRVAQLLGFDRAGTAKVRVQVLSDESKAIADAMRRYGSSTTVASAGAAPAPSAAPRQTVAAETLEPPQTIGKLSMQNVKPVPIVRQLQVSGANQIFVQAGAFTSLENAQKMQQKLAGMGTTQISEISVGKTKYFRVRFGPIQNVPKADALIAKVEKSGIKGARTVVE